MPRNPRSLQAACRVATPPERPGPPPHTRNALRYLQTVGIVRLVPARSSTSPPRNETPRPRARRTPPAERRRQLLDTAEGVLAEHGSDALRMDTVAQAAGVTRPVVYEHFGDRDGLIVALLERHAERVADQVAQTMGKSGSFNKDLRAATRAYLETARRDGGAMRSLISAGKLSPVIEAARQRYWGAATARWSDRYIQEFGLSQADARALVTSHLASVASLAGLCIDGRLGVARATELHVTSVVAALDALTSRQSAPS